MLYWPELELLGHLTQVTYHKHFASVLCTYCFPPLLSPCLTEHSCGRSSLNISFLVLCASQRRWWAPGVEEGLLSAGRSTMCIPLFTRGKGEERIFPRELPLDTSVPRLTWSQDSDVSHLPGPVANEAN